MRSPSSSSLARPARLSCALNKERDSFNVHDACVGPSTLGGRVPPQEWVTRCGWRSGEAKHQVMALAEARAFCEENASRTAKFCRHCLRLPEEADALKVFRDGREVVE